MLSRDSASRPILDYPTSVRKRCPRHRPSVPRRLLSSRCQQRCPFLCAPVSKPADREVPCLPVYFSPVSDTCTKCPPSPPLLFHPSCHPVARGGHSSLLLGTCLRPAPVICPLASLKVSLKMQIELCHLLPRTLQALCITQRLSRKPARCLWDPKPAQPHPFHASHVPPLGACSGLLPRLRTG